MSNMEYNVKIAVLRILKEILNADNVVHKKEVEYMNEVACAFNMSDNYDEEVDKLSILQALVTIKSLAIDEKTEIAKLMGKMIVADENINYNEVKLYDAVCVLCNIEKDFKIEDYPNFILSGFMEHEEIID